jgi:hypothetical protein
MQTEYSHESAPGRGFGLGRIRRPSLRRFRLRAETPPQVRLEEDLADYLSRWLAVLDDLDSVRRSRNARGPGAGRT